MLKTTKNLKEIEKNEKKNVEKWIKFDIKDKKNSLKFVKNWFKNLVKKLKIG